MLADADERVTINRRAGEITISFGGDTNQAAQFARSVPDFVLKGGDDYTMFATARLTPAPSYRAAS